MALFCRYTDVKKRDQIGPIGRQIFFKLGCGMLETRKTPVFLEVRDPDGPSLCLNASIALKPNFPTVWHRREFQVIVSQMSDNPGQDTYRKIP